MDEQIIPFNHIRSETHFMKYFMKTDKPKMKELSFDYGYNSNKVIKDKIHGIVNIAPKLMFDLAHSTANNAEQIDNTVRAHILTVW